MFRRLAYTGFNFFARIENKTCVPGALELYSKLKMLSTLRNPLGCPKRQISDVPNILPTPVFWMGHT